MTPKENVRILYSVGDGEVKKTVQVLTDGDVWCDVKSYNMERPIWEDFITPITHQLERPIQLSKYRRALEEYIDYLESK